MGYLPFIAVLTFSGLVLLALTRFSKIDLDTALKVGGGVATILSIVVGVIEFTAGQREQAASAAEAAYIAATQQLTEPGSAKPMAGIAALAQLAEHDTERTWLMTESLSAFIRSTAPRPDEDEQVSSARSGVRLAPYGDPPCNVNGTLSQNPSLDEPYIYSSCNAVRSLFRSNLAVQTAITAIATRNRKNETKSNAPARFRVQIETANNHLVAESKHSRRYTLRTIAEWHSQWEKHAPTESNRQLLQENQESVLTAYPDVLRRPWLNLADSELPGLDADSGFLEGGNLSRSNLSFGLLPGAKLAMADLSESWLVGADLFGADLRGASLQEADVRGADLGRTNLRQSWMSGASFHRANFWQADLSGAYLIASDMTEVWTMSGARLDDVIAYRADFSRAKIGDKEAGRVCMQRAFLEEAKFRCAVLNGVDLRGADLQDADLTNAQLLGADLRDAQFDGTILVGANLSRTDLRGVDLSRSVGTPSSIEGALVDDRTKLPWSRATTKASQDFFGIQRAWSRAQGCSTQRGLNDEIEKTLKNTPDRSLVQMRETCPPENDPSSNVHAQSISHQQSVATPNSRLEVDSVPDGAEVELDGTFVGTAPLFVDTFSGEHTLKVSKAGYFVWERKFRLSTGNVRMAPELESFAQGSEK
jgi:uncharacterized protein YjbI with pentapeptide repeats